MRFIVLIACLATLAGCSGSAPEEVPPPQQTPAHSNRPAAGAGPMAGAPHGGAPAPGSVSTPSGNVPTDEQIAALQEAFDKSPANDAAKNALVGALVARAEYYMTADDLAPREKYPKALQLYRRAVKLDPDNATAKAGVDQIESIYRSMGRPIPEA